MTAGTVGVKVNPTGGVARTSLQGQNGKGGG